MTNHLKNLNLKNLNKEALSKALHKIPESFRQGIFFGLNSGVITTTGLLAGISQTTTNPAFIVISIISLALSDSVSEAFGLFLSKKAEKTKDDGSAPTEASTALFFVKAIVVLSFLLPLLFTKSLKIFKNLLWPIGWSLFLLFILDFFLASIRKENINDYFLPHIVIVLFVVITTKIFGILINKVQKS